MDHSSNNCWISNHQHQNVANKSLVIVLATDKTFVQTFQDGIVGHKSVYKPSQNGVKKRFLLQASQFV